MITWRSNHNMQNLRRIPSGWSRISLAEYYDDPALLDKLSLRYAHRFQSSQYDREFFPSHSNGKALWKAQIWDRKFNPTIFNSWLIIPTWPQILAVHPSRQGTGNSIISGSAAGGHGDGNDTLSNSLAGYTATAYDPSAWQSNFTECPRIDWRYFDAQDVSLLCEFSYGLNYAGLELAQPIRS